MVWLFHPTVSWKFQHQIMHEWYCSEMSAIFLMMFLLSCCTSTVYIYTYIYIYHLIWYSILNIAMYNFSNDDSLHRRKIVSMTRRAFLLSFAGISSVFWGCFPLWPVRHLEIYICISKGLFTFLFRCYRDASSFCY